jgi:hypothetical protein
MTKRKKKTKLGRDPFANSMHSEDCQRKRAKKLKEFFEMIRPYSGLLIWGVAILAGKIFRRNKKR